MLMEHAYGALGAPNGRLLPSSMPDCLALLKQALLLQLTDLVELVVAKLTSLLCVSNVLAIHRAATELEAAALAKTCQRYVVTHLMSMTQHPGYSEFLSTEVAVLVSKWLDNDDDEF